MEKLRYMHRNPVKRGLVLEPEQWEWSSYRHCAFGESGLVVVNETQHAPMRVRKVNLEDEKAVATRRISSPDFAPELLPIYRQVDLFHFLNFHDHNRMRSCPLEYGAAGAHVFADEGHQFLALIGVGHFGEMGKYRNHPLSDHEGRTAPHAVHHAFETSVRRGAIQVLNGTGNIPDQALDGGLRSIRAVAGHRSALRREGRGQEREYPAGCQQAKTKESGH